MNYSHVFVLLVILGHGTLSVAQVEDSVHSKKILYSSILPVSLLGTGTLLSNSQLEQDLQIHLRNRTGNYFNSSIDDYFQYVPVVQLYLADLLGVKSKNHWFDQTKYLLISNLITSGLTHGLKKLTPKLRPNGAPDAFPSGHTSFAFNNATVLFHEFHQASPLLAYSGYAFASTTGAFRMLNNKHWFSDVLVGAGIGILVTELVYYFKPFKAFNPFKKTNCVSFIPKITDHEYGFSFSCVL